MFFCMYQRDSVLLRLEIHSNRGGKQLEGLGCAAWCKVEISDPGGQKTVFLSQANSVHVQPAEMCVAGHGDSIQADSGPFAVCEMPLVAHG